jgi:hypothetical protein
MPPASVNIKHASAKQSRLALLVSKSQTRKESTCGNQHATMEQSNEGRVRRSRMKTVGRRIYEVQESKCEIKEEKESKETITSRHRRPAFLALHVVAPSVPLQVHRLSLRWTYYWVFHARYPQRSRENSCLQRCHEEPVAAWELLCVPPCSVASLEAREVQAWPWLPRRHRWSPVQGSTSGLLVAAEEEQVSVSERLALRDMLLVSNPAPKSSCSCTATNLSLVSRRLGCKRTSMLTVSFLGNNLHNLTSLD